MKKIAFFLSFISLGFISTFAQNYQTIDPNRTALFVYEDHYSWSDKRITSLYVDSVKLESDKVFYPYRTIDCLDVDCVDSKHNKTDTASCWVGKKVIIKSDGTNIYFNNYSDSIVIRTQAKLNEKWIVFPSYDTKIEAEVIKIEATTTLGQPDSVKTILFRVLMNPYNETFDIDNQTVSISKNYGWIETINFKLFPFEWGNTSLTKYKLIGITNPDLGIQNLTWFDVFDFQPGDVIQTKVTEKYWCSQPPRTEITKTSRRYLERANYKDSLVYVLLQDQQIDRIYADSSLVKTKIDTLRQVIKPNFSFDKRPNEVVYDSISSGVYTNQMLFEDLIVKYRSAPTYNYPSVNEYLIPFVDETNLYYYKGLGGPYYYYESCPDYSGELVYYKKGSTSWGTPIDFTGVESFSNNDNIQLFPNPAKDQVCIEMKDMKVPLLFELISVEGKTLLQQFLNSESQTINLSEFKKDNYVYRISALNRIVKSGKITIQ